MDLDFGVTEIRSFALLDDLSLVSLLALCSLGPGFPFQQGDLCLAAMVKQQVVLVCVVQLLTATTLAFLGKAPQRCGVLLGVKLVGWACQAVVLLSRVGMLQYLLHFWVPRIQVCQVIGQGDGGLFCGSFSVPVTVMPLGNSLMGLLADWDFQTARHQHQDSAHL